MKTVNLENARREDSSVVPQALPGAATMDGRLTHIGRSRNLHSRWFATCAGWWTEISSREEALGEYHRAIRAAGLAPLRPLEDDLRITEPALLPAG